MITSNPIPSAFFVAGYSETGTGATHQIILNGGDHGTPLLDELAENEADPTTGDYRRILYAIAEMLYQRFSVVSPVPAKVSMTRSSYEDTSTGELVRTYTTQFRTTLTGVEVAEE